MDDDDDVDYQSLFFEECQELLTDLQEQLDLLSNGEGDDETVNAAFRAVHSVKGGAAAFGFNDLIGFAHIFETVMDLVRSHQISLNEDLTQLLLRSGDLMTILVERAQDGGEPPQDTIERVTAELQEVAGMEPAASEDSASTEAESAAPEQSADAEEPEDETGEREVTFRLSPGPDFFRSGHDIVKLIRSAREIGLTCVNVDGAVPTIGDFDPSQCPLTWELTFSTDKTFDELNQFFMIYTLTAEVEALDEDFEDEDEAVEAAASNAPASTDAGGDAGKDTGTSSAGAKSSGNGPSASSTMSKSLRVELSRIDRLVNLVGEMLITQAGLAQSISQAESDSELELAPSVEAMSRQLRELQESVMAIRAQPVKSVFNRMPRVVRDLSEKLGKPAKLELAGEHTEVDTTVIEELAEPLTHMLRNAMDHGLEDADEREPAGKAKTGRIRLSAEHKGERVTIVLEDDGRGVNREKVFKKAVDNGLVPPDEQMSPEDIDQLIFHPGFSTADTVSSVSGRGVGMDVVKRKIQALGGRCAIRSTPGKGTSFTITLPLTLAVMDGMTIQVGDQQFILPLSSVVEALRVDQCTIREMPDGGRLLERRGEYLRLISLRGALNLDCGPGDGEMAIVVDTETSGLVALVVDDLIGQRQVVLKSLEANFKRVEGISGATILGDGQVALILDVPSLLTLNGGDMLMQEVFH